MHRFFSKSGKFFLKILVLFRISPLLVPSAGSCTAPLICHMQIWARIPFLTWQCCAAPKLRVVLVGIQSGTRISESRGKRIYSRVSNNKVGPVPVAAITILPCHLHSCMCPTVFDHMHMRDQHLGMIYRALLRSPMP